VPGEEKIFNSRTPQWGCGSKRRGGPRTRNEKLNRDGHPEKKNSGSLRKKKKFGTRNPVRQKTRIPCSRGCPELGQKKRGK